MGEDDLGIHHRGHRGSQRKNERYNKMKSMKRILKLGGLCALGGLWVALFSGCAGYGSISRALAKNGAIARMEMSSPWGPQKFLRVGTTTNTVMIEPDGTVWVNPRLPGEGTAPAPGRGNFGETPKAAPETGALPIAQPQVIFIPMGAAPPATTPPRVALTGKSTTEGTEGHRGVGAPGRLPPPPPSTITYETNSLLVVPGLNTEVDQIAPGLITKTPTVPNR